MWNMRTVQVVPIVVGSLGSVTKNLDKWLGKLNIYQNKYFITTENYVTGNGEDFKKGIGALII